MLVSSATASRSPPPASAASSRRAGGGGDPAAGRRHSVEGIVVHGEGRGRGLGIPTANLEIPADSALPSRGVYACRAVLAQGRSTAAVNIGVAPTFTAQSLSSTMRLEAFLLDHDGSDLYGQTMRIEFIERLRDEKRFESVDALMEQVHRDIARARDTDAPPGDRAGPDPLAAGAGPSSSAADAPGRPPGAAHRGGPRPGGGGDPREITLRHHRAPRRRSSWRRRVDPRGARDQRPPPRRRRAGRPVVDVPWDDPGCADGVRGRRRPPADRLRSRPVRERRSGASSCACAASTPAWPWSRSATASGRLGVC